LAYTLFDHKIATQVLYLTIFGLAVTGALLEQRMSKAGITLESLIAPALRQWRAAYWGWMSLLGAAGLLFLLAGRFFDANEWSELEET
jgi:hypothetical protein